MPWGMLEDEDGEQEWGFHTRYGVVKALAEVRLHNEYVHGGGQGFLYGHMGREVNVSVTTFWAKLTRIIKRPGISDDIETDTEKGSGSVTHFGHGINPDTLIRDIGRASSRSFFTQATLENEGVLDASGLRQMVLTLVPLYGREKRERSRQ